MKLPFFKKKKAAAEQPAAPAKPAAARTPYPLAAHQEVEIPAIHIDARVLTFLRKYDAAPDQLDTQALTDALLAAMQRGLRGEPGGLPMLPAYLAPGKHLPDTEGKRVAVVDAGGTHFRVATVRYEFGHPVLENERKLPMPGTDGAADWTDFIRLTADALAPLLADATHIGICFSYPAQNTPELDAKVLSMTKEVQLTGWEEHLVGADLAERWLPEMDTVVFTSATIAVGDSFEHFDAGVGLDRPGAGEHSDLRLDSSFDFDRNMSVIVAKDMPAPNERGYIDALVELLYDVHTSMGGGVLTLFTNRRDMERVHAELAPRLAREGLDLEQQGRGASARRLRDRFIAEKDLSLLALKSFWEGFDAAGETLRCVVIPKLPFSSPNDPLVREREARDQRAWWKHSLPEAVISVKQAAGRLIRTSTDTGVLVLADSRLVTKRYGRQFIQSLPSKNVQSIERAGVGRFIKLWRASRR